jgi:hypothetical protein
MNSIDLTNTKKEETKMSLQFDYRGNFRIVHNPPGAKHFVASEWKPYTSIAVLVHEGRTYIAGSSFGLLPNDEQVFEVTSVPTSIDKSKEWTDQGGMDMHAFRGCNFCTNGEPCSYVGSETQKKTLARKEV